MLRNIAIKLATSEVTKLRATLITQILSLIYGKICSKI